MQGYVSILHFHDESGKIISNQDAVRYGWVANPKSVPPGWGAAKEEIGLGRNLFLDAGRQCATYVVGNASPVSNYVITQFGVGTGTNPPNTGDIGLTNPVPFTGETLLKAVDSIIFPAPFMLIVSMTLGASECNGFLLTEFGLYSGSGTLMARKTSAGINKVAGISTQLGWRLRF